jgi:Tol biopolymer transport system component
VTLSALCAAALLLAVSPAVGAVPKTTRTSMNSTGVQANGESNYPVVSGNGRWTAYESAATNLTPSPDVAGLVDVFVSDAKTGQTIRIAAPGTVPNGASRNASVSGDGQWIAFERRVEPGPRNNQ